MSVPVYNQSFPAQNRPMGRLDAQGRPIPSTFSDLTFRADYTGSNLIYRGLARPGALTSDPVWQISFFTYDGSGNLLSILWPQDFNLNASADYQFIWDNRTLYAYL